MRQELLKINWRNIFIAALLISLFAIEAYCVTYYQHNTTGFWNTTVLFITANFLICVLPFFLSAKKEFVFSYEKIKFLKIISIIALWSLFVWLCYYCIHHGGILLKTFPSDYTNSDMIPQIKVCCHRFIHGQKVYAPIPEIWNGLHPTYLPMMWLPWVPFEYFTNDLRWTTISFFIIAVGLMCLLYPVKKISALFFLIPIFFIVKYFVWFFFTDDTFFIPNIHEPVVIFFYLLLGFGLIKNNPWIIGIAMGCCVLSRYMLVFWIPVFILYLFLFEDKRKAIISLLIVVAMVLFIFILPFFIWQPHYFSDVIAYYHHCAIIISRNYPNGLGKLFSNEHLPQLIFLETLSAVLIPVFCFGIFYFFKKKLRQNKKFFGLCSLKMTMLFFYAFLEIPMDYLYFVPAFFSLPICILAIRQCD